MQHTNLLKNIEVDENKVTLLSM